MYMYIHCTCRFLQFKVYVVHLPPTPLPPSVPPSFPPFPPPSPIQLVESETVAENTKARCEGQGTPFFRFSPKLPETVATGETDNIILINMLISTMVQTIPRMEDLHKKFQSIAEANQKERYRKRKAKVTAV